MSATTTTTTDRERDLKQGLLAARAALMNYGTHRRACCYLRPPADSIRCDCGLWHAIRALADQVDRITG